MDQIILHIKDSSKLPFLMQLIQQLDFVEVKTANKKTASANYDFFSSAGLWANRNVNSKELRKKAWERKV